MDYPDPPHSIGCLPNLIPKAHIVSCGVALHYTLLKIIEKWQETMINPNINMASHCEFHFLNLKSLFKKIQIRIHYLFQTTLAKTNDSFVCLQKEYEYESLHKLQNSIFILFFSGINFSFLSE